MACGRVRDVLFLGSTSPPVDVSFLLRGGGFLAIRVFLGGVNFAAPQPSLLLRLALRGVLRRDRRSPPRMHHARGRLSIGPKPTVQSSQARREQFSRLMDNADVAVPTLCLSVHLVNEDDNRNIRHDFSSRIPSSPFLPHVSSPCAFLAWLWVHLTPKARWIG